MQLNQYVKNVCLILWNMIAFLCPVILQNNIREKEITSFSDFVRVDKYLKAIYKNLKELIYKIKSQDNNNKAAESSTVVNNIYQRKNSVLNRINNNNKTVNQALNNANLLYIKRLKDALATQILISKQHFFRLGDKCDLLYPFLSKNYCSQYIF